jgi:dipeptidyl aminopeptidase/acylaminoacyl peptidase
MRNSRLLFALALIGSFANAQTRRPIRDTDLYDFRWIADAKISPDGSKILYTIVNVNTKHDGYETALWMIQSSGGAARQLTAGPRDSGARWSPDGKTIAFLRAGRPGQSAAQIHLLFLEGGEARPLTDLARGAGNPVWSPDGKSIAFTSSTQPGDTEEKDENKSDVRIVTKAAYRNNGAGYAEPGRPGHIWVVDVPAVPGEVRKARRITDGEFSQGDPTWSRDGSKIFYTSDPDLEPYYTPGHNEIYSIDAKGGQPVKIAGVDGAAHGLSLSPNGQTLTFTAAINKGDNGVIERSYSQPDLWVTAAAPNSTPRNLTMKYDFDIAGGVGGDQAPPRAGGQSKAFWSKDGRYIFINTAEEGKVNVKRFDAETGEVKPYTDGNHDVFSFDATPDGSKVALLISSPTQIGDLYTTTGDGHVNRLTDINEKLFSQLQLTEPAMFWYKSFDGQRIQTWAQRPPDFREGKQYPMILDIHGGPHAAYGYTFDHEFQWMAAKGYVVLYPNPRGSTSYGQDFGNVIQYHYPGDDHKDLMAGVDEVIKKGWVDPEKLGITGGSGGGVLTNWAIGHTDRFKAAVSQRSIADWSGFWYTADFTQFTSNWFRGAPWESEDDYKARSPITYITKVKTPTMFVEGDDDMRTPPADGGEQMFRALKYLKIPTVMIRFPGETHELSRSGRPTHRVERLDHIVAWMDKYINGQEIHTYDVR